ncbi:hypothetical protein HY797_04385 [Candidatus Falkowbacteria bacterium]|nr:hypothetical protein [Candidatus Falkowbacteria bacterium]
MKLSGKKIYLVSVFAIVLSFFLAANFCLAAFLNPDVQNKINAQAVISGDSGYDTSGDIYGLIQVVINAVLSIVGVLLLVYILLAGYNWMTAQGEEEKVNKAKDTLKQAIIGVIIIVAAYAISVFVMSRLEAGALKTGSSGAASYQGVS